MTYVALKHVNSLATEIFLEYKAEAVLLPSKLNLRILFIDQHNLELFDA